MRAVVVSGPGEQPMAGEFRDPEPTAREGSYQLVAAGVHQVVKSRVAGSHYSSAGGYPQVPGIDAVGRGEDGRLVYAGGVRAPWGTMAQRFAAPMAFALPDGADPLTVAAGMNPAMSGWLPIEETRADRGGELGTVIVVGATGTAGRLAVQAAQHLGASRVIALGRNESELARLADDGAITVALAAAELNAELTRALAGSTPTLVLDYLWGPITEQVLTALTSDGGAEDVRTDYVQIGAVAGKTASVPAAALRSRPIIMRGSGLGSVSPRRFSEAIPRVLELLASGVLRAAAVPFTFAQAEQAWNHSGRGRAVIVPD